MLFKNEIYLLVSEMIAEYEDEMTQRQIQSDLFILSNKISKLYDGVLAESMSNQGVVDLSKYACKT